MVFSNFKQNAQNKKNIPEELKSRYQNILTFYFKKFMFGQNLWLNHQKSKRDIKIV